MKKNKRLYYFLMLLAVFLFIIAVTVFDNTKLIAPILIVISIYLLIGATIKLCQTNKKLKDSILCAIDLLFWLP